MLNNTGITATAGIGDKPLSLQNRHGHRAQSTFRRIKTACALRSWTRWAIAGSCWSHRPLTDFWRVGGGIARKLERYGMYTMGDVARCSLGGPGQYHNEDLLYKLFGVNAELLIDHAWGWEPCTHGGHQGLPAPPPTASAPARCCKCPIPLTKRGWSCGKWPICWRWIS